MSQSARCRRLEPNRESVSAGLALLVIIACVCPLLVSCAPSTESAIDWLGALRQSPFTESSTRWLWGIAGAMLLLAGWKLHRLVIAIPGFAVGCTLGVLLTINLTGSGLIIALVGLSLGGLGAWLAYRVFRLAVFVGGALAGILVLDTLWNTLVLGRTPVMGILIGAAAGGSLFLALVRLWMPLLSSAMGAAMIVGGLGLGVWWLLGAFAVGLIVQYGLARALGESAFARTLSG